MKIKNAILPIFGVFTLGLTSCNSSQRIKRVTFSETNYENATKIYNTMKETQKTSYLNKGTITIKYSIKAKGKARIDDMTFHNLDLNASAGFIVSWSVDDNYLKLEGDDEIIYYKFTENLGYWRYEDYTSSNQHFKYRIPPEEIEIETIEDFKDLIIERIDDYSCLHIPGIFSIGFGLTGTNRYVDYSLANATFEPDYLFDSDFHSYYETLKTTYADENQGYYVNTRFGTDGDNTVSSNLSGKIKATDWHEQSKMNNGTFNIDIFSSFKDNYLSQAEFILSGNAGNLRMSNFNCELNIYLSEEVQPNVCTIDQINHNDYKDDVK